MRNVVEDKLLHKVNLLMKTCKKNKKQQKTLQICLS
jgi:hypothetical protein